MTDHPSPYADVLRARACPVHGGADRDQCAAARVPFFFKQWVEFPWMTPTKDFGYPAIALVANSTASPCRRLYRQATHLSFAVVSIMDLNAEYQKIYIRSAKGRQRVLML